MIPAIFVEISSVLQLQQGLAGEYLITSSAHGTSASRAAGRGLHRGDVR
jgi:hypothetical protein